MTLQPTRPARFNAQWLMAQDFPPIEYVVPGLIPEGLSILVAAPKIGKSWMVLGLAHALSDGGTAFGCIPVGTPRPVLYLALEDGHRRLQSRLRSIGADPTDLLEFVVNLDGDPVEVIGDFVVENADRNPVVILDTLGKVKPPTGAGNAYSEDYSYLAALKARVDAAPGSSLIIVHHTRKSDATDFLDAVSGTQGIAGAADTILLLKRDRGDDKAALHVTSRDAMEGEYALTLSSEGVWELVGQSLADAASARAEARATANLGEDSTRIVEFVNRHPEGVAPIVVATALGIDNDKVGRYLRRAADAGRIERADRGRYAPATRVRSDRMSESEDQPFGHADTSDTYLEGVA